MSQNDKVTENEESRKEPFDVYLEAYPVLKKQKSSENAIKEYKLQINEEQKTLTLHPAKEFVLISLGFSVALCVAAYLLMLLKTGFSVLFISLYGFAAATVVGLCVYLNSFSTKHRKARRNIKRIKKQISEEEELLSEARAVPSFDEFIKKF